eukprot:Rmarinus@m.17058
MEMIDDDAIFLEALKQADALQEKQKKQEAVESLVKEEPTSSIDATRIISKEVPEAARCLRYWDVPEEIDAMYKKQGVTTLYAWQAECLSEYKNSFKRNLLYSAPTSGGKTLVSEVLMINTLFPSTWPKPLKVIFILPFVSICVEKVKYFKTILEPKRCKVKGFYSSQGGDDKDADLMVCTIEKANGIVNRIIEEERLDHLGMVVVDELHMMGDRSRGYILELLLTKLRFLAPNVKIVGMSATLPNLDELASWLDARLYRCPFRPVRLVEYVRVASENMDQPPQQQGQQRQQQRNTTDQSNGCPLIMHKIHALEEGDDNLEVRALGPSDPDGVAGLVYDTISQGFSVLVFCPTRRSTENCALAVAKQLRACQGRQEHRSRNDLVDLLKPISDVWSRTFGTTLLQGVAFHHAGLTVEEREIIEKAFREGVLCVLVATSTLAAGVNLPARRVIFRNLKVIMDFGQDSLNLSTYKQMSGRAGRAGKDNIGESIMICNTKKEVERLQELRKAPMPRLESSLAPRLTRLLLEVVALGRVQSIPDAKVFMNSTLLSTQWSMEERDKLTDSSLEEAVSYLKKHQCIEKRLDRLKATDLGMAVYGANMEIGDGLMVYEDLSRARKALVLETPLHVIYLCTPISHSIPIDWETFSQPQLMFSYRSVAEKIPLNISYILGRKRGRLPDPGLEKTHSRFYAALILSELVEEEKINVVARKYGLERGNVQNLQTSAASFAGMVSVFCSKLDWGDFSGLVEGYKDRLGFGAKGDITSLLAIENVKSARARLLYDNGYTDVERVANANASDLDDLIRTITPRRWQRAGLGAAIIASAKELLQEQVDTLASKLPRSSTTPRPRKRMRTSSPLKSPPRRPVVEDEAMSFQVMDVNVKELRGVCAERSPSEYLAIAFEFTSAASSNQQVAQLLDSEEFDDSERGGESEKERERDKAANSGPSAASPQLISVAVCFDENSVYHMDMASSRGHISEDELIQRWGFLEDILSDPEKYVVLWNAKDELVRLRRAACEMHALVSELQCRLRDPMVALWLTNPDQKLRIARLGEISLDAIFNDSKYRFGVSGVPKSRHEVICLCAVRSLLLMKDLSEELLKHDLVEAFEHYEMPVLPCLVELEYNGIGFSEGPCFDHLHDVARRLEELRTMAHKIAGRSFDLGSSKQTAAVAFDLLQLRRKDGRSIPKTAHGYRSTAAEVMKSLTSDDPIKAKFPFIVLEYRSLNKIHSEFLSNLPRYKRWDDQSNMPRIYAKYRQTSIQTGRIAIVAPNLQQVPRECSFFCQAGMLGPIPGSPGGTLSGRDPKLSVQSCDDDEADVVVLNIRRAFVPQQGYVILSADYGQMEARLLMHFSKEDGCQVDGEAALSGCVTQSSMGDVFVEIAAKWHAKARDAVSLEERMVVKRLCYGMLYGMGVGKLAEELMVSEVEAKRMHEALLDALPGVRKYMQDVVTTAKNEMYNRVRTVSGRFRKLHHLLDTCDAKRAKAERQAVNTTIQGSAADLMKRAMARVYAKLAAWRKKGHVRVVLQLHDELLFEVKDTCLCDVVATVEAAMQEPVPGCRLPVNMRAGPSWGSLHPVHFPPHRITAITSAVVEEPGTCDLRNGSGNMPAQGSISRNADVHVEMEECSLEKDLEWLFTQA